MNWIASNADLIFSVGSFVLTAALLPSLWGPNKPALSTSILTGTVLAFFSLTYLALGFYLSAGVSLTTSLLWGTLAVQKWIKDDNRDVSGVQKHRGMATSDNPIPYLRRPDLHRAGESLG